MKQFDVFEAQDGLRFCVLQSDLLLDALETVMIAPLVSTQAKPIVRLTPAVKMEGERYLLDIPQQVPVRAAPLHKKTPVGSLRQYRDQILDAVNLLYWGI